MSNTPPILHYVSRQEDAMQSLQKRAMRFGLNQLVTAGLAILMVAGFVGMFLAFSLSAITGIVGLLVGLLLIPMIAGFIRSRRRVGGMRIIRYLDHAMKLKLPLPQFLLLASGNETRHVGNQLRAMSGSLSDGILLGDALRNEAPELPQRVSAILRSSELNGTLPVALDRLVKEIELDAEERAKRPTSIPVTYLCTLVLLLIFASGFIAIFVAPKLAQIMQDFGVRKGEMFWWLNLANSEWGGLAIFLLMFIAVVLILMNLGNSARLILGRGRGFDPLRGIRDRLIWWTPLAGRYTRDSNYSDVCQTLSDAITAHRPIDLALQESEQPHLNVVLLGRLEKWRALVSGGQTIGNAARSASMPNVIANFLPDQTDADGFAHALSFLANHYRLRAMRTMLWLTSTVMPLLTFFFGAIVFLVAYSIYTTVWRLIDVTLPYKVGL